MIADDTVALIDSQPMFDAEPGVLIWQGAIANHQAQNTSEKLVRVVRVGFEIRHEQLDGLDSMGVERWNPLESRLSWRLMDALATALEELAKQL